MNDVRNYAWLANRENVLDVISENVDLSKEFSNWNTSSETSNKKKRKRKYQERPIRQLGNRMRLKNEGQRESVPLVQPLKKTKTTASQRKSRSLAKETVEKNPNCPY